MLWPTLLIILNDFVYRYLVRIVCGNRHMTLAQIRSTFLWRVYQMPVSAVQHMSAFFSFHGILENKNYQGVPVNTMTTDIILHMDLWCILRKLTTCGVMWWVTVTGCFWLMVVLGHNAQTKGRELHLSIRHSTGWWWFSNRWVVFTWHVWVYWSA